MIDTAVRFLVGRLNAFLPLRVENALLPADGKPIIEASRLVDDAGKSLVGEGRLGIALINLEEERILKGHLPETTFADGVQVVRLPPVKLYLHLLIAANYKQYDVALKMLGYVITCFQANPTFTPEQYADLDPSIERLTVELQSPTYEQLNQIWAFVGGKQIPSVIYKARIVSLQDIEPAGIAPPITRLTTVIGGR